MESRTFIKEAKALIEEIRLSDVTSRSHEEEMAHSQSLQKRVTALFVGLQNPTLPTAYNLRDTAMEYGFTVSGQVLDRLRQFEYI